MNDEENAHEGLLQQALTGRTNKPAAPLSDEEWKELQELQETALQNAEDRNLAEVCSRPEELTEEQSARLAELTERLFATVPNRTLQATAMLSVVVDRAVPDLEEKLRETEQKISVLQTNVLSLERLREELQRELVFCTLLQERMPLPQSPEEQKAHAKSVERLNRLLGQEKDEQVAHPQN